MFGVVMIIAGMKNNNSHQIDYIVSVNTSFILDNKSYVDN